MFSRHRRLARILAVALVAGQPALAADLVPRSGPVPPLALDRIDGETLGPADFAGRPVLVHFFATWCEPCVAELAALDRLAEARAGGMVLLAVDVGEVDARVRRFLEAHPVGFPVLMDRDRAAARAWGVVALPSSYLLDAGHAAVAFAEGPVAWDDPGIAVRLDALVGSEFNKPREGEKNDQPA